ncbi:hypothetical protein WMY93_013885 [Mugilogobius chulae]|uniref:Uncharacterized protein n=1 Tax=Mugilogobius chulae TaxID=88201 RepID=A0AAW0PCK5_9GOBI
MSSAAISHTTQVCVSPMSQLTWSSLQASGSTQLAHCPMQRQCQLYWCRKDHTRQTDPVSAAAEAVPRLHIQQTYAHYKYSTLHMNTSISQPLPNMFGSTGTVLIFVHQNGANKSDIMWLNQH